MHYFYQSYFLSVAMKVEHITRKNTQFIDYSALSLLPSQIDLGINYHVTA